MVLDAPPASHPRRAGRRIGALVMVLVLIGLVVAVVLFSLRLRADQSRAADREAVLHSARQLAVNVTSISHQDASKDIDRILDGATGDLAQQFRDQREGLIGLLGSTRASSQGRVLGAGIVSLDDLSAEVLVAVDATVSNVQTEQGGQSPTVQMYRMDLQLSKVGHSWRVEKVLFAGAPA